jgi:5-guanidino-2-oxopentanoate decarboxylase
MSQEHQQTTVADAVVGRLAAHGLTTVFGIPGIHNFAIYRALAKHGLRHVTVRHEQGAGFAADGYARTTGRPALCVVTTGPGLTNISTAVGQAYTDSVPMVVLSPALEGPDDADLGRLHETRSQSGVMRSVAAWSRQVSTGQAGADAVDEAFRAFSTGRPRPVHLEIPLPALDLPAGPGSDGPLPTCGPAGASPEAVAEAAALLQGGKRIGIIAGGGAWTGAAEIRALAERLGAAVVTTTNGKGTLDERHPLALGATIRLEAAGAHLSSCDVILAIGTELAESDLWRGPLHLNGSLIRLDIDAGQSDKNAGSKVFLHGDAAMVTRQLLDALPEEGAGNGPTEEIATTRQAIEAERRGLGSHWMRMVEALEAGAGPDATLATDSAMVCYYGAQLGYRLSSPRSYLYPTGFGTLGYALPAAIGAKLATPEARVLALSGDGGLQFTLPELATAVEERLAIPIVVSNNCGYGEIRNGMGRAGIDAVGVDLHNPDFCALAEAYGAHARRLDDLDGLAAALGEAFAADLPTLIEVPEPADVG